MSRRLFLGSVVGGAVAVGTAAPASATIPSDLPLGTVVLPLPYQNWSQGISTGPIWSTTAASRDHLVKLANWAYQQKYRLRPTGFRHNWSPLTIAGNESTSSPVLLVDTRLALQGISVASDSRSVRVGAGVSLEALLTALEWRGLGLTNHPRPG